MNSDDAHENITYIETCDFWSHQILDFLSYLRVKLKYIKKGKCTIIDFSY